MVFDVETKKSFAEIGTKDHPELLGISVLAGYSYQKGEYFVFEENELNQFEPMIKDASMAIGFNIRSFDIPVLQPYMNFPLEDVRFLDMMDDVVKGVGFRVGLNNLAKTTIGIEKSADGLQALEWFKEGQVQKIKDYCVQDVKVTKDLFEFGKKNGFIKFFSRDHINEISIPVRWGENSSAGIFSKLKEAFEKRLAVEIDYVTANPAGANQTRNRRLVDIYRVNKNDIEGYCHLRRSKRIFRLDRILAADITDKSYKIQDDVQESLL